MTEDQQILRNIRREQVGHVAVDAGQIIVCDPCYMESQQLDKRVQEMVDAQISAMLDARNKDDVEGMTLATPLHYSIPSLQGHEGAAVVVQSGVGDGYYPVYATFAEIADYGERVVRLEVDFLDHPWLQTVPLDMPDAFQKLLEEMLVWLPGLDVNKVDETKVLGFLDRIKVVLEHYTEEGDEEVDGEQPEDS